MLTIGALILFYFDRIIVPYMEGKTYEIQNLKNSYAIDTTILRSEQAKLKRDATILHQRILAFDSTVKAQQTNIDTIKTENIRLAETVNSFQERIINCETSARRKKNFYRVKLKNLQLSLILIMHFFPKKLLRSVQQQ